MATIHSPPPQEIAPTLEKFISEVYSLFGSPFKNEEEPGVLLTLPDDFLLAWCEAHPAKAPAVLSGIIPLFRHEGDDWTWRPLAYAIIDRYGKQQAVLSAITSSLGIFLRSGSLVPYHEIQVHPLEQLRHQHIPEVRRWAGEHLRYVQERVKYESTRDNEHDIGIF